MKLPYVFASALQIIEARQTNIDAIYTGLLPKDVLSGTLFKGKKKVSIVPSSRKATRS